MGSAVQSQGKRRAFFFDRDGVINKDSGYVCRIEDFHFVDDVFSVLRSLSEKGYLLFLVTNQSGIGRGYYTEKDFQNLTEWMLQRFADEGVEFVEVYSCPHDPDDLCDCRKPEPGMLLKASKEYDLDLSTSWMIGDKESDMEAAVNAGISNRVLLGTRSSLNYTHKISSLNELLTLPV